MEKKDLKELIYNINEDCLDIIRCYENIMKPRNWHAPEFSIGEDNHFRLEGMAFFARKIIQLIEDNYSCKLHEKLLEVIKPYMDDFTGYDEKEQEFDIVLAVKELLERKYQNVFRN